MAADRYALVDSNRRVVNVIVYDPDGNYTPPAGLTLVRSADAGPGDTLDGRGNVTVRAVDRVSEVEDRESAVERQR